MTPLDPDLRALQDVRDCSERAWRAAVQIHDYSQEQIDALCAAMAAAGARAAFDLARLAVEETDIGRVHFKVLKNLFGSQGTWDSIKDEKTVGVISRDRNAGVIEVATPVGVVAGIVPTTNPTSTSLFKALIAVKGKNAIVISPHPRARRCIGETVEVLRRAIERAGGPPDLVCCLENPTIESTGALMKHPRISVILATGGSGLVNAAYSSGKPAYGVGPGNTPVYVDRSADARLAGRTILQSQNFDNATLCCSEQALILDRPIAQTVLDEMVANGAHLCSAEETRKLEAYCNVRGHMNADVVGKDPWRIAEGAGFSVPRDTALLLAHQGGVGKGSPLSIEILAPLLSVHLVDGWQEGCRVSMETLQSDGLGHTCGVWATDETLLEAWYLEKPANRILVNGPCSQGAVGYSTNLEASFSLGCGPQAGNITSDNITARHLINVKRVAVVRNDWPEIHRRDHARVAAMGGEEAPRGTGLPGDPALAIRTKPVPRRDLPRSGAPAASNWQGNPACGDGACDCNATGGACDCGPAQPAVAARSARPATTSRSAPASAGASSMASKVRAAPKSPGAFVTPAPRRATPRLVPPARPARAETRAPRQPAASSASRPAASHAVGGALSPDQIREIMAHAGDGCPLGPCQGCPQHNVATGACEA